MAREKETIFTCRENETIFTCRENETIFTCRENETIFTCKYLIARADAWGGPAIITVTLGDWHPLCVILRSDIPRTVPGAYFSRLLECMRQLIHACTSARGDIMILLLAKSDDGFLLIHGDNAQYATDALASEHYSCSCACAPSIVTVTPTGVNSIHQLLPDDGLPGGGLEALMQCLRYCIASAVAFSLNLIVGYTDDVTSSVSSLTVPLASGTGVTVFRTPHLNLCARRIVPVLPPGSVPMISATTGSVIAFAAIPISPVFSDLYVEVASHALDVVSGQMLPVVLSELYRLTSMLESVVPPDGCGYPENLILCSETPSLHAPLMELLGELARCSRVDVWRKSLDERPLVHSLVKAVALARVDDIQDRTLTQAELSRRLQDNRLRMRESEGIAFDILLMSDAGTLPLEWQPVEFYSSGDAAFISMLYLHQWNSTLRRIYALASEAGFVDTASMHILPELEGLRGGIVWHEGDSVYQSQHRRTSAGEHLFFFNPSARAFTLQNSSALVASPEWMVTASLQTQTARVRDSVVAFFVAQAVALMAPLLCPRAPVSAAVTLMGMYEGSVQQHDLRHEYREWQKRVRTLRQRVPTRKRRLSC